MLTFYDSKNQPYVLAERVGSGGEGTVFLCPDDPQTVAKIYHEPISDEKGRKLRWMADNKDEQLLKVAAWIVDTLHDAPDGKVVGFLMPNVKAKEIHELYSLKSRRVYFPEATWQFLVHTAANVARAFYALHRREHVMGDVNHGNCVVLADGTVKLIDCDSYSIKIDDYRYPCEVGVATHLAPELQGVNLSLIERAEKHDNFGLAVIVFQLLFLGRHPFAGNYTGGEDKSLEDCIRELRFAYGKDAHLWKVKQPPGTLSLDAVSPRVAMMFERAFLTEDRPTPREWIEALEDLSNNLQSCKMHPGHHFYNELDACPWCALETQTGLMLFPFVSQTNRLSDGENFNIFTVENLVASLDVSSNLPAVMPKSGVAALTTSKAAQNTRKVVQQRLVWIVAAQIIISLFCIFVSQGACFFIPLGIVLIVSITVFNNFAKTHKIDLEVNLDMARRHWEKLAAEWSKALAPSELGVSLTDIRQKIGAYQNLHRDSRLELKKFQDAHFQREIENYLASFRLTENHISGIGEKRLAILRSFGVKTAADIEQPRLRSIMPGMGDASVRKLLDWRRSLEQDFQYQPDMTVFQKVEETVEQKSSETRQKIEREIGGLLVALRSNSARVRRQQQELSAKAGILAKELAQAEKDMTALKFQAPALGLMIFVAFFMYLFGNIVYLNQPPAHVVRDAENYGSRAYDTGSAQGNPPNIAEKHTVYSGKQNASQFSDDMSEYYVSEKITDAEIAKLNGSYRDGAAAELYRQTLSVSDNNVAEKKLRLAVRLNQNNLKIINKLGITLYDQKKYQESLKFLKQSAANDSINTQIYIGMNQYMLKNYREARQTFTEIIEQDPSVQVAYYNLGLACKQLKDYPAAIEAFRKAVDKSLTDTDSRVEIGICLFKKGDREGARRYYGELLNIDSLAAEKLRKQIDLKESSATDEREIIQAK